MNRIVHPHGILLVSGACFVALAFTALLIGVLPADVAVREALLKIASDDVFDAMSVINYAGTWIVLVPGTLLFFVVFKEARARWWIWIALMLIAAVLPEGVFKWLVHRPRPEAPSLGFPSGHATAAAAFLGAVMYLAGSLPRLAGRVIRVLAPVCMVLVAVARVILRAHWPSDALGGIALGLALASAAALIASRYPPSPRPL